MCAFLNLSHLAGVYLINKQTELSTKSNSIMALIKNEEQREVATLQELEQRIEKRAHRERIHHLLICGLAILSVVAFISGHCCGKHCKK